jgi:HJR/Mrr/RecB family endonuclease
VGKRRPLERDVQLEHVAPRPQVLVVWGMSSSSWVRFEVSPCRGQLLRSFVRRRADDRLRAVLISALLALTSGCGNSNPEGVDAALSDGPLLDSAIDAAVLAQPYVKASNTGAGDTFGAEVALSADGTTLVVGASREDSAATGVGGNQADNTAPGSGAVYVFTRAGTTWAQQAYIKASNTDAGDSFGCDVALSADGSTLAVGALNESSAATGVSGNQADNSAVGSGAVYVFTRAGTTWTQQAYLKASNTGAGDIFGTSIALSGDGTTLTVGAMLERSAATGVGGNETDNTAAGSGAAYVFTRTGTTWTQQAYVKASNTGADDTFGNNVALASDGSTLAVAAYQEDSAATGVDGDQANNTAASSGAVYVFARTGTTWAQQAYIKASNAGASDTFGIGLALSSDGSTLAVGAHQEASSATGVGGDQANNSALYSGAVYVFARSSTTWTQQAYVKASNTDANDIFGYSVALSTNGSALAVAALDEGSGATGIGGNQADNSAAKSGAVYMFNRAGTSWTQRAYVKASNTGANDSFGICALSADGSTLAVGAYLEDGAATGIDGNQADNSASNSGAVYLLTVQ